MKRVRAPNFTNAEIINLIELVERYPIIKDKRTDAATIRERQRAWQYLTAEYNAQTKIPRTADNLIACYRNQKTKERKKYSNMKVATNGEGSPPQPFSLEGSYTMYDVDTESAQEHQAPGSIDAPIKPIESTLNIENSSSQPENDSASEIDSVKSSDSKKINIIRRKANSSVQSLKKGKKGLNVLRFFQELVDNKKELVKAQKTLVEYQVLHQKLEIELAETQLQHEKKKQQMEINFLQQKYQLELDLLRNKKY